MAKFLELLLAAPEVKPLLSSEHFSVDGTLLRAWASHSSLERIDGIDDDLPPPSSGKGFGGANGGKKRAKGDFRGLLLSNQTHRSRSDGEARLFKKAPGVGAFLSFMGHCVMENRHGLVVASEVTQATGRAVGGPQGRPQHHDVDEGRREAGLLHRGLRGAAGAPGRLHAAADRRLHQARHARHLVRARLGRHAPRAADPRHAPRRCGEDARHCRGSVGAGARIQGRLFRRARRRAGALGMGGLAVRPAAYQGVRGDQGCLRSAGPAQSRQDRARPEVRRPHAVPLRAGLSRRALSQ